MTRAGAINEAVPVSDDLAGKVPQRFYIRPQQAKVMPLTEKMIDRFFVRFNSIYGHLWSSRYQSLDLLKAAKAEWARDLGAYSVAQISKAIEDCKRAYKKPPTLPEFLEFLRVGKQGGHRDFLKVAQLKSSVETAAPFRDQLKAMLR